MVPRSARHPHARRLVPLALAVTLLAPPAAAQPGALPPEVVAGVARLGRVIDPPETAKLFAPLQEKEPYARVTVRRDLKYGHADRHLLDVFTPHAGLSGRPVLIYVHGGAFVGGNKRTGTSPFYDNVALWAARNGFVGVTMTYRLAPEHPWPTGALDVASAVRWVIANIGAHGGDPGRVYLMGHSAGAVHVADYVGREGAHGSAAGPPVRAAILVSGVFDLTTMPPSPPFKAYYGEDPAPYAYRSPLAGLLTTPVPLLVAWGDLDPPDFERQSGLLRDALCKEGRCPRTVTLVGHSHMSEVYAINTKDTQLTSKILELMRDGR